MKGEYDKAIADCDRAIELDPKDAMAYYGRGQAYDIKGEYDKAIADYNQAVKNRPKVAAFYVDRGDLYREIGDYNLAIKNYDNAVRLYPNYADDFVDCKFRFGGQVSVDEAIKLLNRIVKDYIQSENKAAAAYYSGVSILFSGNKHKARRRFKTARELGFKDDNKIAEHLENLKS